MTKIVCVAIAYLLGCISPSTIIGKIYGVDIKKEGSGNAGTTNALRVLGKKAALITLVIDIFKGVAAVLIGTYFGDKETGMLCAVAVFCGHLWPVFYRFKGGKGVATAFGVLTTVYPPLGLSLLAVVGILTVISKRMSVGSIGGALLFTPICLMLYPAFLYYGMVMAAIIIIKHRTNIMRLIHGEEPPMSIFVGKEKENHGSK